MSIILYTQTMLESKIYKEVHPCSICRVPNKLRDLKEDAYTPKSIFMGLLPRGETSDRQDQLMVELKWHYMDGFLHQGNHQNVQEIFMSRLSTCSAEITIIEIDIRASYDGNMFGSELTKDVIGKKMILDGCFLLHLLGKLESPTEDTEDPIFETREKMCAAVNDITLLENQIPFIVLKKLYRITLGANAQIFNDHRVDNIVQRAFGYKEDDTNGCAHILDFMHFSTVQDSRKRDAKPAKQVLVRCATKLLAAGIIINPTKLGNLVLNVRKARNPRVDKKLQVEQNPKGEQDRIPGLAAASDIENRGVDINPKVHDLRDTFDFDINFNNESGELRIPVLNIKETTEVRWRNLIAWEQSKINIRCQYTSYALFFKGLICCESDIELLQKKGVIVLDGSCDRSKEDLMTLFSTISKGAEHMDSRYTRTCNHLNGHMSTNFTTIMMQWPRLIWHKRRLGYETSRNCIRKCWRGFSREMQSTPWKIVGVGAATMLLILTIMQTYYSSRSVK